MDIHLTGQQVAGMIIHYYKKYEQRDVTVNIACGKSIKTEKYLPPVGVVYFDVSEVINDGEKLIVHKIPLVNDIIKDIIATVLRETGYESRQISFDADPKHPLNFIGISVTVDKMEKTAEENKHI